MDLHIYNEIVYAIMSLSTRVHSLLHYSSVLPMCLSLSLSLHSHDINTAGVEAIEMHGSFPDSKHVHGESMVPRLSVGASHALERTVHFYSYPRDRLLHMGRVVQRIERRLRNRPTYRS
jgi:hypothetical protein